MRESGMLGEGGGGGHGGGLEVLLGATDAWWGGRGGWGRRWEGGEYPQLGTCGGHPPSCATAGRGERWRRACPWGLCDTVRAHPAPTAPPYRSTHVDGLLAHRATLWAPLRVGEALVRARAPGLRLVRGEAVGRRGARGAAHAGRAHQPSGAHATIVSESGALPHSQRQQSRDP